MKHNYGYTYIHESNVACGVYYFNELRDFLEEANKEGYKIIAVLERKYKGCTEGWIVIYDKEGQ